MDNLIERCVILFLLYLRGYSRLCGLRDKGGITMDLFGSFALLILLLLIFNVVGMGCNIRVRL
jgi:hypothetical protein